VVALVPRATYRLQAVMPSGIEMASLPIESLYSREMVLRHH
jgi:hypothetical protein